jgi:hypothetical protein
VTSTCHNPECRYRFSSWRTAGSAPWTALVADATGDWVNGTAVFTKLIATTEPEASAGHIVPPAVSTAEQVRYFKAHASRKAYELATYLAARVPLTLPVMRLAQSARLSSSRLEVFLSNLLRKAGEETGGYQENPAEIEYEFQPGVRDEPLNNCPPKHYKCWQLCRTSCHNTSGPLWTFERFLRQKTHVSHQVY